MSGRLPELIDPFRLAEQRVLLDGELAFAAMPRLAAALADAEGGVQVHCEFGVDEQHARFVRIEVRGDLQLQCQRCMGLVAYPVQLTVALAIVGSEAAAERLLGDYEPLIVREERIPLAELIEDELLLALPVVARHADEQQCAPGDWVAGAPEDPGEEPAPRKNPFAVLGELKRK